MRQLVEGIMPWSHNHATTHRAVAWRRAAGLASLTTPAVLAAALLSPGAPVTSVTASSDEVERLPMIVREAPGSADAPERALAASGGTKGRSLDIIDGYTAMVPANKVQRLRDTPGIASLTPDVSVNLSDTPDGPTSHPTSMHTITHDVTGAAQMWESGHTGEGVDVALIDSGVVPVDGLRTPGKVLHGPDLSFEGSDCSSGTCAASPARHLDSFGHGTHMAGIIAGRDDAAPKTLQPGDTDDFLGMAPDSRIVNVKVADASGAADVSQVIAGIEWVVKHGNDGNLNVRVLNLSFGTDGVQNYQLDPLAHAAEAAWHEGIVVVAAAGNGVERNAKLDNPAYDPFVLAVGAADGRGTPDVSDDVVPAWSARGDGVRNPDLVAPGASVISLASPGSAIDVAHPDARTGTRFFRGSGTSQAAAVTTGAAALIVQQRPDASPDEVKALLMGTARPLADADSTSQGNGLIDLEQAGDAATPRAKQTWRPSRGTGSLHAARGTHHVTIDGEPVVGEVDVTGRRWNGRSRSPGSWDGGSWNGGRWNGGRWNTVAWGDEPEAPGP